MKQKLLTLAAIFALFMASCKEEKKQEVVTPSPTVTDSTALMPVADESQMKELEEAKKKLRDSLNSKESN